MQNHNDDQCASGPRTLYQIEHPFVNAIEQDNISLSRVNMPASPGDPEEQDFFSWSHEQGPVESDSSSASPTTYVDTGDECEPFSLALVMAENRRQQDALRAHQRASGGLT
ncbi:hypothetical protein E4T39_00064 [Aureobasidium subglaciale]|nr:hypothetical protein E4T39_00064 [Aureobasidium subglaciale]